jgi:hypothetical protein
MKLWLVKGPMPVLGHLGDVYYDNNGMVGYLIWAEDEDAAKALVLKKQDNDYLNACLFIQVAEGSTIDLNLLGETGFITSFVVRP